MLVFFSFINLIYMLTFITEWNILTHTVEPD